MVSEMLFKSGFPGYDQKILAKKARSCHTVSQRDTKKKTVSKPFQLKSFGNVSRTGRGWQPQPIRRAFLFYFFYK